MELHETRVETRQSLTLPWQETLLMPIGDVQVEESKRFREHIKWGIDNGAYFIGMGDYVDMMSPSNRKALQGSKFYDSVTDALEQKAEEHIDQFLDMVKGTEGRWLGLLEGHHYFEFGDGTTSDTRIAEALDAPFLGTCAFVRLRFARTKTSKATCTIWCHHGSGGGHMASGPLNKLESIVLPTFDADLYLIGHMSKVGALPVPYLYMDNSDPPKLRHKKRYLVGTGGFSEGYRQNNKVNGRIGGSFVEKRLLKPVSLGGALIKMRPVNNENGSRIDLNVEV